MLDAIAMKLESIAEAETGVARLANTMITGTYALEAIPGASVTILEQEGRLVQRVAGFPDRQLVFLAGNRYRPENLPDGAVTSFRTGNGRTELLIEVPFGAPTIRVEQ